MAAAGAILTADFICREYIKRGITKLFEPLIRETGRAYKNVLPYIYLKYLIIFYALGHVMESRITSKCKKLYVRIKF